VRLGFKVQKFEFRVCTFDFMAKGFGFGVRSLCTKDEGLGLTPEKCWSLEE